MEATGVECALGRHFSRELGPTLRIMGDTTLQEVKVPPPADVVAWVHLGAAIATRAWHKTPEGYEPSTAYNPFTFLQGSRELVPMLKQAFTDTPHSCPDHSCSWASWK